MVRQGRTESYLEPPSLPAPTEVEVRIPDDADIEALRDKIHATRAVWHGELEGWPATYRPSEPKIIRAAGIDRLCSRPARFEIGGRHLCWLLGYV